MSTPEALLAATVREEWGRLVALLVAGGGRVDLVEDALGDAVEAAARTWPEGGAPDNPSAWLLTAARRRMLDRLRTEGTARRHAPEVQRRHEARQSPAMADPGGIVEDDLLRLVMMCAHPALAPEAAAALSLRLVLGVPTADVARLFAVPEATMAARITRAKKKIVTAGVPFAVPGADALPERLDHVALVAYLAFTAGYAPRTGPDVVGVEEAGAAVRLARVVHGLRPDEPVLVALLALVLLQHSRRDARAVGGRLVLLADQDRTRWHHDEITEAVALLAHPALRASLTVRAASYTLQARIAAEHALAQTAQETRWDRIVGLYDLLLEVAPSPAASLARVVALAEAYGADVALGALETASVPANHRTEAVRAELLARSGHHTAALAAYDRAIAASTNEAETTHLRARRGLLG